MKDQPPLTPEQLELIWDAVQYQIGSFEYLSKHDRLWKLAPLEINKHEQHFLKRKSELQRLARDIEERLPQ